MELMMLGINLLLIYAAWRWMWRKTALDEHRDQLFDLRDEIKAYFISRGLGTDHPIYIDLRKLVNAHIRYTEKLTFRLYLAESVAWSAHPETLRRIKAELDARFVTDDADLQEFITKSRALSIAILKSHMVESSFMFLLLLPLLFMVLALVKLYKLGKAIVTHESALRVLAGLRTAFRIAPLAGLVLAMPARAGIFHPSLDSNMVEEYSYQAANVR